MIRKLRKILLKILANRLLQHLAFWLLSYLILVNFFSTSAKLEKIDFIYTAVFHISLVATVYLNLNLLIPRILNKGRYFLYFPVLAVLVLAGAGFNHYSFDRLVDHILPEYFFISFYDFQDIVKFFIVYTGLTTLLKLSRGWFLLMTARQQLMQIQQEKTDTELKALKSQINPHFLFNSLNNIYSLALSGSPDTPDSVLKLSDMMRYMLYESNEALVPLDWEIRFLNNYVELQKLRSDHPLNIEYTVQGTPDNLKIAPLLMLPFVENGFKHGIKGDTEGGFINIRLSIDHTKLEFSVKNNIGEVDVPEGGDYKGIGLENVRRRLDLLYPENASLDVRATDDTYEVQLELRLEKDI